MRGPLPSLPVLQVAAKRGIMKVLGRSRHAFDNVPTGLALSPSARHFADYDSAPLKLRYATGHWPDAAAWQESARAKLAELTGYAHAAAPPELVQEERFPLADGLSRRRVYLRAQRGLDIPVHIIAPTTMDAPRPVMICLQGTTTGVHLCWGEVKFPDDIDKRRNGYDYATQAAKRGYIAIAIEQSCFGERTERQIRPRSPSPCIDATLHAMLLGRSLMGERCSDVSAVIDWLTAEHEALDVDPSRIHVMGHSSGGAVAMHAAALDLRIGAVLACGCLGFIRDTFGRRRDDLGQEVIPGILNWMEIADVVGLIAPRPFVTVAGQADHIWPASGATAVVAEAKKVYAALGAPEKIVCVAEPGGHTFRPVVSWRNFEAATAQPASAV